MPVRTFRGRDFDGRDDVLLSVSSRNTDRELAAREDYRLGESVQHEAQCRCRVGHGVGAVKNDESVVVLILLLYQFSEILP